MKVKIVAQFTDSEGNYAHSNVSDAKKPIIADVRDSVARGWIANGWAIELAEKKPEPKPEPEPQPERAVIETPEDHSAVSERETASVKRKKK